MRIAFYNVTATYLTGGLETYCWEAGRALSRRGHRVSIVAGARGEARHDEVQLVQFPFRAEKEWPDLGVRFRRLAERASFARHAMDHLLQAGYDAIIINKPFDFPVLWRARQRGLEAATLFRSGGTDFFAGDRWFAGAVEHWVSASRYNAQQVTQRYQRAVQVIHNGVDIDHFCPPSDHAARDALRARLNLPTQAVLLVSVGRLVGWKGVQVILQTLPALPPQVHYLVVGDGPARAALTQQATALGVAGRVHFAGAVAHPDLPALLGASDVFLQPSVGEEAFGISVVEAMACGLPVLASHNGGLPEIIVDNDHGRLLRPGDVAAWGQGIRCMLEADLPGMGRAARQRATEHFTWAANAARLENTLCE